MAAPVQGAEEPGDASPVPGAAAGARGEDAGTRGACAVQQHGGGARPRRGLCRGQWRHSGPRTTGPTPSQPGGEYA